MFKVIAATNNKGKLREVKEILEPRGYKVYSLNDLGIEVDPEETGNTYTENAIIKATAVYEHAKSFGKNYLILSDDSGLELEALDGRPGLYTHREIKGDPNNLLNMLTPDMVRNAKFVCSACLIECVEGAAVRVSLGELEGSISNESRGNDNFQIYSTFIPSVLDNGTFVQNTKTLGELDNVSSFNHRYSAIAKLFGLPPADHI